MYCHNCGKEIVGAGAFCQSCGARVNMETVQAQQPVFMPAQNQPWHSPAAAYQAGGNFASGTRVKLMIPKESKLPLVAGFVMLVSLLIIALWGRPERLSIVTYMPFSLSCILFFTPFPKKSLSVGLIPLGIEALLRYLPISVPFISRGYDSRGIINIFDVLFERNGAYFSDGGLTFFALESFAFFLFFIVFIFSALGKIKSKKPLIGCVVLAIAVSMASGIYFFVEVNRSFGDFDWAFREAFLAISLVLFYVAYLFIAVGLKPSIQQTNTRLAPSTYGSPNGNINPAYTRLGGGLLAFVVIYIIGLLRTIDDVSRLFNLISYVEQLPILFVAMFVVLLGSIFLVITIILIFAKNNSYRTLFNLSTISYIVGLNTVLIWCESNDYRLSDFMIGAYIFCIVFEVATIIIWNIYFAKSIRVETYFAQNYMQPMYGFSSVPHMQNTQPYPGQPIQSNRSQSNNTEVR